MVTRPRVHNINSFVGMRADRPPPPPPPPGRPPQNTPWFAEKAEASADGSGSDFDEEELEWSRGERVLSEDGAVTARRLACRADEDTRMEQHTHASPLDDFEIEVR